MPEYIMKIETLDTGGGIIVDVIHLPDGRVIGISEDCAILYANMNDFFDPPHTIERYQEIDLRPEAKIYLNK